MSDYQRTLELVEIAQDSAGRSTEQFGKYAESIEYKVKQLQNTWEQFRISIANSETYGKVLDFANQLLNTVSKFDKIDYAKWATLFFTVGRYAGTSFIQGLRKGANLGTSLVSALSLASDTGKSKFLGALSNRVLPKEISSQIKAVQIQEKEDLKNLHSLLSQREKVQKQLVQAQSATQFNNYPKTVNELQAQLQTIEAQINTNEDKIRAQSQDRQRQILGTLSAEDKEKVQAVVTEQYQAIGATAATALTAAFISVTARENPIDVFLDVTKATAVAGITALISVISTSMQKGLSTVDTLLTTSKTGLIILGITAAIGAAAAGAKALSNYIEKTRVETAKANSGFYASQKVIETLSVDEEELGQKAEAAAEKYKEASESYKDLTSRGEKLEELSQKMLLTNEEQEEFNKLSNEMAELFPDLVKGYDAENNAIIDLADSYQKLVDNKEKAVKQAALEQSKTALDYQVNQYEQALAQYQGVQDLAEKIQENPIYQALATGKQSSKLPDGTFIDWSGLVRNGSVEVTSYNQDGVGFTESYSYKDLSYRDILKGFLNTDARGYGKELSEVLKGTSFKLPEKDADVIQSILDQLQTDNTGTKLDEFRTAFATYSNNFDVATKYLQSQRSQLQTAAQTYAGDYLALNNLKYQGITDKNAQVAFQNYALSQAGIDFDQIEKNYDLAKFNGDYEAQARAIQGYITTTLEKASTAFDSTEFSPQVISTYEKITKAIADGLNIKEIAQIAQEGFGDTDLYQLFTEQFKTQIDKYNENLKAFIGALGTAPATFNKGTGLYETDNSLINNLMTIGSEAQDKLVKAVQDATSTGTLEGFVDGLTSLTDKDINLARIFNYNWENTLSGIAQAEAYFIEKYGEEIGNQILSIARQAGLIDFRITNVDELEDFEKSFSESISTVSKQISSYGSIVKNYRENGRLNLSDINTLSEIGAPLTELVNSKLQLDEVGFEKWIEDSIKEQGNLVDSVVLEAKERLEVLEALKAEQEGIYTASVLQENYNKLVQDKNAHIITQKELNDIISASDITSTLNQKIAQQREIVESLQAGAAKRMELQLIAVKAALEDANKTVDETPSKVKTLQETYEKAADALAEKQQTLINKQKELNKVLYGDSTHKNKLDELYNYQTALDVLKEKADDAKEALEDLDEQNPANLIDDWLGASRDQSIYLAAENDRYRTAIRNTESMLRNQLTNYMKGVGRGTDFNVSDYFYYNPALDRYFINQQKLNQAQMNDQLKDFVGEQVDLMNTYKKNIKTNQNEIKKLDKEWIEYQKSARDNYVSVQNEIVERLKSSYQEEIDSKEKMYEALKEADDNYVNALEDAINRQRRLRDEQDKWDSLATKEKRLSLLQRDTSGAQQKETLKLQKEIEKDRTSLLDKAVDNVVEELKELYTTQQETRSKELEYQQSILDNSNLVVEANAIMQSWKSMDEMIAWMYEHTEGIENMSDQAVEQLTDDWKEMFNNIQIYNETSQKEVQDFYTTNTAEVQRVLNNTTESLTNEAQRAFRETSEAVNDSINTAEKAVTDAMDALKESQEALTKAQNEYNEALARMSTFTKDIITPDQQVYYGTNYMAETAKLKSQTDHTTWKTMEEIQDQAERTRLGIDNDNLWNLYKQYAEIVQSVESSRAEGERRGYQQELDRFLQGHKAYMIGNNIYIDDEAQSQLEKFMASSYGRGTYSAFDFLTGQWKRYADGGLANYTGPAWVDGSNSKPEAFLSAEDTQRIGSAAKILANLPFFKMDGSLYSGTTTTVGDTNVELHIHVDSIATESQVDYLINRIKEDIVDSANPIGTPVVAYR